MLKSQKGITLVALVVTVIILIILAAVTITMTLGENGIFGKTKNAAGDYKNAITNEQQQVNALDSYVTTHSTSTPAANPGA